MSVVSLTLWRGKCQNTDCVSIDLMSHDTKIGIVTAAGYTEAKRYYGRLHGLLEAIKSSKLLTDTQKHNLVVMGMSSTRIFS